MTISEEDVGRVELVGWVEPHSGEAQRDCAVYMLGFAALNPTYGCAHRLAAGEAQWGRGVYVGLRCAQPNLWLCTSIGGW